MIFLFLIETICCDPSYGPSHQDGSDEGSQHVFMQTKQKLSLIITKYSILSRALYCFWPIVHSSFCSYIIEQSLS